VQGLGHGDDVGEAAAVDGPTRHHR
jgi:hypothetical protein